MKAAKRNYEIAWTLQGTMTISATDEHDAQAKFDKMDVHRLLKGRPTSLYGKSDADYTFCQNADPAPR